MGFITLEEAKEARKDITQREVDALEAAVRELSKNRFYRELNGRPSVRYRIKAVKDGKLILGGTNIDGLFPGDRVELGGTRFNKSLLTISDVSLNGGYVEVVEADLLRDENTNGLFLTLLYYPEDVKSGVLEVIRYKDKMVDSIGLKAFTVASVRKTYFDMRKGNTVEGVPAYLFDFLEKYEKLEWGG